MPIASCPGIGRGVGQAPPAVRRAGKACCLLSSRVFDS